MNDKFGICFVSGKLGDVDGVSLEVNKWIDILADEGHSIYTIAGKYASPLEAVPLLNQFTLEQIRFDSDRQRYYERQVFPFLLKRPVPLTDTKRKALVDEMIIEGDEIATLMYEYIQANDIDVIIAQNTNAMPMTLLGGLGVYNIATKMRVATIFHHHDFWWERSRFSNNAIDDLLNTIMPPVDLGLEHVVISSYAAHILAVAQTRRPSCYPELRGFRKYRRT